MLAPVHEDCEPWRLGPELVGDLAPPQGSTARILVGKGGGDEGGSPACRHGRGGCARSATRQRREVVPGMRAAAALNPLWSSEITPWTPRRSRRVSEARTRSGRSSPPMGRSSCRAPRDGPGHCRPPRPGSPASRTFMQVISSQRYRQSPSSGWSRPGPNAPDEELRTDPPQRCSVVCKEVEQGAAERPALVAAGGNVRGFREPVPSRRG